ncbi:hypothetical protein [Nonomuraea aurantiaca]|uniref:hypothetical protein n=1 Tax=Nonomuraea aurantiaca TaxID=2878562 RepID=UPI001CD9CDCE|nr:hypothetical protein [Nonomuraea aurantiaca]MCA2221771.1 hypothetical protein [Nonomuraea aurantiaca]
MRMLLAVLSTALIAGCAVDATAPARTAERFHAALAAHQEDAACALLSQQTAEKLPDPGQTCADALRELKLGAAGPITSARVWGDDAQVRLAGDTVFLHRYSGGWRVTAASCRPRGDRPYDCGVEN